MSSSTSSSSSSSPSTSDELDLTDYLTPLLKQDLELIIVKLLCKHPEDLEVLLDVCIHDYHSIHLIALTFIVSLPLTSVCHIYIVCDLVSID